MRQVVDGEDGGDPCEAVVAAAYGREPHQRRGRVPIVCMDDVRTPPPRGRELERGAREERETVRIVVVPVDARPVEEVALRDQVQRDVAPGEDRLEDPRGKRPRPGGNGQA